MGRRFNPVAPLLSFSQLDSLRVTSLDADQASCQTLEKAEALAACQIRYACLFCFLSPIAGYSYTGRFKALSLFIGLALLVGVGLNKLDPKLSLKTQDSRISVGLSIGLLASAENSLAIWLARSALRQKVVEDG